MGNINPKIITVHEIGFPKDFFYIKETEDLLDFQSRHFAKYDSPHIRNISSLSVVEIGNFSLPIMKIKPTVKKFRWFPLLSNTVYKTEITGHVDGGWIKLSDKTVIYVQENENKLKMLIEYN